MVKIRVGERVFTLSLDEFWRVLERALSRGETVEVTDLV